jgi:tetratricopeptide (TPR) repeat protein
MYRTALLAKAVSLRGRVLVPFGVTFVLGCIGTVLAQETSEAWKWCEGRNGASADLVIKSCTTVIQSGRENTENLAVAFYNRGKAYADKGDLDRAIQDFDQAIRLDPRDPTNGCCRPSASTTLTPVGHERQEDRHANAQKPGEPDTSVTRPGALTSGWRSARHDAVRGALGLLPGAPVLGRG